MEDTTINNKDFKDDIKTGRKRKNPFADRKEDKSRRQKKRARVIIRNISYKCNEEDVKKHFSQFGEVEEVNLLKRSDGKLVGCAFVQFATINQATKAILKGNNQELKGRNVFVDWAIGKDEYTAKKGGTEKVKSEEVKEEKEEKYKNTESKIKQEDEQSLKQSAKKQKLEQTDGDEDITDNENNEVADNDGSSGDSENEMSVEENNEDDSESYSDNEEDDGSSDKEDNSSNSDADEEKDSKLKNEISKVKKEKHISNDVKEGCTVFLKNVHFDVEENELRKLCRKYGPIYYVIINREPISGHSKGTAFVKFKSKESADLCIQAGSDLVLMDQIIEPYPALSKEEIRNQANEKAKNSEGKDSRNLYLAREGLIMTGSKAAEGVSESDMKKRHELERIKTQVLKNLNRFVSRNRLSIHNLPASYDNEKLRQMAITYTGFKPHECRVMRENKITVEHPKGKSKGFGFLSFSTHQEALTALRKLNNNPNIFSNQNRPIVAFSIEDRAVHKIKEKRKLKSKLNNPTYKEKLEKRKEVRNQTRNGIKPAKAPQNDSKTNVQRQLKKLEETRNKMSSNVSNRDVEKQDDFVGTAAKPGTSLRMRSNRKINEQAQEHRKNVREKKRIEKQRKIRQEHLAERKAEIRPKQGKKVERDDLEKLVNKYKNMITGNDSLNSSTRAPTKKLKSKRKKWYTGE